MEELTCRTEDGFPLAVQVTGIQDGPPLLLLQGQANSHIWWDRVRPHFDRRFRVITFDYRGTGSSRGPVETWTTAGFAEDACSVLDRLGVSRSAVYGTSMGGRIAQILAASHGRRIGSMVLACTTPGGSHAIPQPREVVRQLRTASPAQRIDVLHGLFFSPPMCTGRKTVSSSATRP